MHNPESVLENETQKILWSDTNGSSNLSQTTRPYDSQQQKKKENLPNSGLCYPDWPQSKTKSKWKER